jgi:hypothetical protein
MQMKKAMAMELRLTYEQTVWECRKVRLMDIETNKIYESTKELFQSRSEIRPATYFRAKKKAIDGVIRVRVAKDTFVCLKVL